MKIARIEYIVQVGKFATSKEWKTSLNELKRAISSIVWPPGSAIFSINPKIQGNGVKPIKEACMLTLNKLGWSTNERTNPLRLDAIKSLTKGRLVGVEWETGNISSSHRAINRLFLGYRDHRLTGGVLVVPTRDLYHYLTDRVGNFNELEPYLNLWKINAGWKEGVLAIIAVEHDKTDPKANFIKKGTDGRALV